MDIPTTKICLSKFIKFRKFHFIKFCRYEYIYIYLDYNGVIDMVVAYASSINVIFNKRELEN